MPAENIYPYTTTIRSIINEEFENVGEPSIVRDSALLVGLAQKGPKYAPLPADPATIEDVFGEDLGDRSLVHAYKQIAQIVDDPSVLRVMRVGKTTRPSLDIYEFETGTGIYAPTYDPNTNAKWPALHFLGAEDTVFGKIKVEVEGDGIDPDSGLPDASIPSRITITNLDTGAIVYTRLIDPYGEVAGARSSVGQIIDDLTGLPEFTPGDENFLAYVYTQLIDEERNLTITASGEYVDRVYDAPTELSGGGADKIAGVKEVYSNKTVTETIDALGQVELDYRPVKDITSNTPTIDKFMAIVGDDILESDVSPIDAGKTSTILKSASIDEYAVKATPVEDLIVELRRGSVVTELVEGTDFEIDGSNNFKINFLGTSTVLATGLQVGDNVTASYKYEAAHVEAKVRSTLQQGDRSSYFVIGSTIIFGAPPLRDLEITYTSKINYALGSEVTIGTDANTGLTDQVIFLPGALDTLEVGDVVTIVFNKFPELPAPTGYVFTDNTTQAESMKNGNDGTTSSMSAYKQEVKRAFDLIESYPARWLCVCGAYLDQTVIDDNPETGLAELRNIGWHTLLEDVAAYKSEYTGECQYILAIAPPAAQDTITMQEWLKKAVDVSANDPNRAANIMLQVTDYHAIIPAGAPAMGGVTKVNPALVLLAMKLNNKNAATPLESFINAPIPFGVFPMGAEDGNPSNGATITSSADKNKLSRARYTSFGTDVVSNTYVVLDHPTGAKPGSNLQWQNTVENVFDALREIRRIAKPFIGKRITDANIRVMKNNILQGLKGYIEEPKQFITYDIDIQVLPGDRLKGTARIKFKVVDAATLRNIVIETSVEKGGA